jgi:hypothetical protein
MEQVVLPLAALALLVLVALSLVWRTLRSESMLEQWARANHVTLVGAARRAFSQGPFFWTTGKAQMVYFVTVRDSGGHTRHAWVRCGGSFLGMLSDTIDVRWED